MQNKNSCHDKSTQMPGASRNRNLFSILYSPFSILIVLLILFTGCASNPYQPGAPATLELRDRAFASLKQGVAYPDIPVVRANAIEAMKKSAPHQGLPWIRNALKDEAPMVRFAALFALGSLKDADSINRIKPLLNDADKRVRVAAVYAMHRLGNTRYTGYLAEWLLYDPDPTVKRNAAMVLGRLGDKGAVKLLAKVAEDRDEGLRLNALESMALLESPHAISQLKYLTCSGIGARETFAIDALGKTLRRDFADMYLYKLQSDSHPEIQLASAEALGKLGRKEGLPIALKCANFNSPNMSSEVVREDPPEMQIIRARQKAATALGEIGDFSALPLLAKELDDPYDPRVELAVAAAIMQITSPDASKVVPIP